MTRHSHQGKYMLSFDRLLEIGQDAAGVIEVGSDKAKGLFTANVESCVVSIYVCKRATIMVHDSGQLKMSHVTALIKSYGTVRKLIIIHGHKADGRHTPRLKEIIRVAGVAGNQLVYHPIQADAFAVRCNLVGEFEVIDNSIPLEATRIPDRQKRQAVCEVNNFFLEPRAQTLPLDIQYREGSYAPVRALDKPISELLTTVEKQPEFFFQNLAVLNEAHNQKLLVLPPELLNLVEKYHLERLRTNPLSAEDSTTQLVEHKRYVSNKSVT